MPFPNERRRLKLADSNFVYLSEGAYSVVFINKAQGRVRKVFRSNADEDHVRNVFKAEIDACRLAKKDSEVAPLVPDHFKVCCAPQIIIDKDGNDISGEFIPGLAFEMEYIDAHFQKFGSIGGKEAERVRALFNQAGILHTTDMSVCLGEDGRVLKAIDFAIEEHELLHRD